MHTLSYSQSGQREILFPATIAEINVGYSHTLKAYERHKITSSQDAIDVLRAKWQPDQIQYVEEFKTILLDRGNRVLGIHHVSKGGQSGTVADPKTIFSAALKAHSAAIILAHNHPSGQLKPSQADLQLTHKLKEAGKLLDLPILDHVILTVDGYFSWADHGIL